MGEDDGVFGRRVEVFFLTISETMQIISNNSICGSTVF